MIPGNLIPRQQELFYKNPLFAGMKLPEVMELESLEKRYPKLPPAALDLAKVINLLFPGNVSVSPSFTSGLFKCLSLSSPCSEQLLGLAAW